MRVLWKVLVPFVLVLAGAVPLPGASAASRPWVPGPAAAFAPRLSGPTERLGMTRGHPSTHESGGIPVNAPEITLLDPKTDTLYVTADDGVLSVADASRCTADRPKGCADAIVATVPGAGDAGLAFDRATRTLYAASSHLGTISVVDATTCNARTTTGCGATPPTITTGGVPIGLDLDPDTHTLYAGHEEGVVSVIDTAGCNRTTTATCGNAPAEIATSPGGVFPTLDRSTHTLYVPEVGPEDTPGTTMAVIDTSACKAGNTSGCTVVARMTLARAPIIAVLDPTTRTLYVENIGDNNVSIVDADTCNATTTSGCAAAAPTVQVGNEPDSGMVIDQRTRTLFVPNAGSDTISAVDIHACHAGDTSGCAQRSPTIATGPVPFWITLDRETGTLYVPEFHVPDVAVFDARSCNSERHEGCRHEAPAVDLPDGTFSTAVDVAHHTLLSGGGGGLDLLDTDRCNAHGCDVTPDSVPLGTELHDVLVDAATHTAYLVDGPGNQAFVLDTNTCHAGNPAGCTPVATVPTGQFPVALGSNRKTHTVYAANIDDSTMTVIDGAHCDATDQSACGAAFTVPTGPGPFGVTVDASTNSVYVTNVDPAANAVQVFDGAGCEAGAASCVPVATIPVGTDPVGLAIDGQTRTLYVANSAFGEEPGSLSVIDLRHCHVGDTAACGGPWPTTPAGRGTWAVAVDRKTHAVYTANFANASVSVVNGADCNAFDQHGCGRPSPRVPVGDIPLDVTVDPVHRTVFSSDAPELAVSIIDARAPCSAPVRCLP